MAEPKDFEVKTREQIRADYTRTIRSGLIDRGIANPNVSEGSLDYLRGDALGAFGEEIGNLVQIKANAQMPDTAGKTDPEELQRIARLHKTDLRPAGPSIGPMTIFTTVSTPVAIPSGAQLLDSRGLSYEVITPGPFSHGETVQIQAIDTGEATNLEQNEPLRWVSPPPFVQQVALVGLGGLWGGVDQETIEELRQRVLDIWAHPRGGGNWSQVIDVAENSTSIVKSAFCYCAVYGGNTMHVAVTGRPSATNKSRVVPQIVIDTVIAPAVIGEFPTFADIIVTGTVDWVTDISMSLNLPASTKASPPGPGGGWADGNPWPRYVTGTGFAFVVSVIHSASFVIRAEGIPVVGTHFVYVSPGNFRVYHASITSCFQPDPMGFPLDWQVTTDIGLWYNNVTSDPIHVNDWVFPDAEKSETYIETLLSAFASLGPAEKTSSPGLLPRALRKPLAAFAAPAQVGPFVIRRLIASGEEVNDAAFLIAIAGVPVAVGYQLPPYQAIPGKIAFYPE